MASESNCIIITGPSGSGKTTLSERVGDKLGSTVLSQDNYFKRVTEYQRDPNTHEILWDHPKNTKWRHFLRDIRNLGNGFTIESPIYDKKGDPSQDPFFSDRTIAGAPSRKKRLIRPLDGSMLLVEGHQTLALPPDVAEQAILLTLPLKEAWIRRSEVNPLEMGIDTFKDQVWDSFQALLRKRRTLWGSKLVEVDANRPLPDVEQEVMEIINNTVRR